MSDFAHDQTDLVIEDIEKRLAREYEKAEREVRKKCEEYFRKFKVKDSIKRDQVKRGVITDADYAAWRRSQMIVGAKWESFRDQIAEDYANANLIAKSIMSGYRPDVYALNHNFATYLIEKEIDADTYYTLYNREAVERMLRKNPRMLPPPGAKKMRDILDPNKKDVLWNKQQVQSIAQQAITQGKPIYDITKDIEKILGERNHKAAIRNARTLMTGAENGGREDAYKRAEKHGIRLKRTWVATLDERTRYEHRQLDGMTVGLDEPFVVPGTTDEINFPGDPTAKAALVYNCRCRTIAQIEGFERDTTKLRNNPGYKDMTYDEWKASHKEKPNPITLPESKRWKAIHDAIEEYKK